MRFLMEEWVGKLKALIQHRKFSLFIKSKHHHYLINLLRKTYLFSSLSTEKLLQLYFNSRVIKFPRSTFIVKENEIGNSCYVIARGSLGVFTYDQAGREIALARLEKGDYFGEQSLLAEEGVGRRNASVRSLSTVILIEISRADFVNVLQLDKNLKKALKTIGKKQLLAQLVAQHHVYQSIRKELRSEISHHHVRHFKDQEIIFSKGDFADCVYLLLSGTVEISFSDAENKFPHFVQIRAGHLFGELGALDQQPRSGTAKAIGPIQVLYMDASKFREVYSQKPELQNLLGALRHVYQIPTYGVAHQHFGRFVNMDAVCTAFKMNDGSLVIASRVINSHIFSISRVAESEPPQNEVTFLQYESPEKNLRLLSLHHNHCISCICYGPWEDLGKICGIILHNIPFTDPQIKQFLKTGSILLPEVIEKEKLKKETDAEIICECMQLTRGDLIKAIESGCTQFNLLSEKTGAGTVCGSCQPQILALLGHSNWFQVKLDSVIEHTPDIRSYRFKPINNRLQASKPGQYIVIQAFINNRWVERTFSLTSYSSTEPEFYEITVKHEPQGLLSDWFFLKPSLENTLIRVSEPHGKFFFNTHETKPAICFIAGIGIAPVIAFIRAIEKENSKRQLHIDYSVHSENHLIFKEELQNLTEKYPNISLKLRITSREGHISNEEIVKTIRALPNADIYICAPKDYRDIVMEILRKENISRIYVENFISVGRSIQ